MNKFNFVLDAVEKIGNHQVVKDLEQIEEHLSPPEGTTSKVECIRSKQVIGCRKFLFRDNGKVDSE